MAVDCVELLSHMCLCLWLCARACRTADRNKRALRSSLCVCARFSHESPTRCNASYQIKSPPASCHQAYSSSSSKSFTALAFDFLRISFSKSDGVTPPLLLLSACSSIDWMSSSLRFSPSSLSV